MNGIETLGVIVVSHDVYVVMQWISGIIIGLMLLAWIIKCADEEKRKARDLKERMEIDEAHRKYKQLQKNLEMEETQRRVKQFLSDKNIKL